jgi:hypothetical protein
MTLSAVAQKTFSRVLAPENDSATIEQCRNGSAPAPGPQCVELGGALGWVTGNAGSSNSHWNERDFISYRMLFGGLAVGTPSTVIIGYDVLDNGKHAIDYLGSVDATETDADPCSGQLSPCPAPATAPIPTDPDIPATIPQIPGVFKFYGATFGDGIPGNDPDIIRVPCPTNDDVRQCILIRFIPQIANPILAWGGHIAWRGDWGAGQSAGGINGSPYHMRLVDLNGQGGNQDLSLSANAVFGPGSLRVIKTVTTNPFGTESAVAFWFNANRGFSPLFFGLVDDNAGPGIDNKLSDPVLSYNGIANVITVTEDTSLFPAGQNWSFNGVSCTVNGAPASPVFPTVNQGSARGVTVTVPEEGTVVCTFSNTQLAPSAAPATISGRVVDSFGNGIGGARLTVMDGTTGQVFSAISSPFGYYTVEGMEVDNFYVMSVSHKRYTFADDTRTFSLQDDISGVDFVANP